MIDGKSSVPHLATKKQGGNDGGNDRNDPNKIQQVNEVFHGFPFLEIGVTIIGYNWCITCHHVYYPTVAWLKYLLGEWRGLLQTKSKDM